jgi:CBS domain-containing protein
MGEQSIKGELEGAELRSFMQHLLDDLRAFERMWESGLFERKTGRIGAEQELFLVDRAMRPAPVSLPLLERLDDPHFTTEIAAYNLEINLDPLDFSGRCLSRLHEQIDTLLDRVRVEGRGLGVSPVLVGILPTVRMSDTTLESMTPKARYFALDRALSRLRNGLYEFRIKGVDELIVKHDCTLIEGCNTSFQVHLQVDPDEFAPLYNIAQAIAAPVLAAAVNSPLLFGRRLWRETRIALFQQAVDTRTTGGFLRERSARVTFGSGWVERSPLDLYRDDVTRFRALIGGEIEEDPLDKLERGIAPELYALRVYNGTVYRWNRACYGLTNGMPHIRIENRVLPSGPTTVDEMANAAFWLGLMYGMRDVVGDVTKVMSFDDARMNFIAAARLGLAAQLSWFGGESIPADTLVCERLIPIAREGLQTAGVDDDDADRYLGVLHERVASRRTGAQWAVASFDSMRGAGKHGGRLNALVAAMIDRQEKGEPVARWDLARIEEAGGWDTVFVRVDQFMTTDLFTVQEDESLDLVASIMDWRQVRHVPVEDHQNRLVGIVSYRTIMRLVASGLRCDGEPIPVSRVMKRDPISVTPETSPTVAVRLMRMHHISALPVVKDGRLVGIVTERDFMEITADLLEAKLEEMQSERPQ